MGWRYAVGARVHLGGETEGYFIITKQITLPSLENARLPSQEKRMTEGYVGDILTDETTLIAKQVRWADENMP